MIFFVLIETEEQNTKDEYLVRASCPKRYLPTLLGI